MPSLTNDRSEVWQSPAGESFADMPIFFQRPRGQTMNSEPPRSRSQSPVFGETSGRDPFAQP
jgi:hypothetical protein